MNSVVFLNQRFIDKISIIKATEFTNLVQPSFACFTKTVTLNKLPEKFTLDGYYNHSLLDFASIEKLKNNGQFCN